MSSSEQTYPSWYRTIDANPHRFSQSELKEGDEVHLVQLPNGMIFCSKEAMKKIVDVKKIKKSNFSIFGVDVYTSEHLPYIYHEPKKKR